MWLTSLLWQKAWQKNLKEGRVHCGSQFESKLCNDKEVWQQKCETTRMLYTPQGAETEKRWCSALSHIQSETAAYEWGYLCSCGSPHLSLIYTFPHRHTQRLVSCMTACKHEDPGSNLQQVKSQACNYTHTHTCPHTRMHARTHMGVSRERTVYVFMMF